MARSARTDPVAVCLDADVVIAGLFSTSGASHAVLLMGEIGLLAIVLPEQVVIEVRRNLTSKLPEALPAFERFLESLSLRVVTPPLADLERSESFADPEDRAVLAAALAAGAGLLVTHDVRHFRRHPDVRIVRPATLVEEERAWLAQLGD